VLVRRLIDFNRVIDLIDVHEAVAQCARHRRVQLGDDGAGALHRRKSRVDAGAQ